MILRYRQIYMKSDIGSKNYFAWESKTSTFWNLQNLKKKITLIVVTQEAGKKLLLWVSSTVCLLNLLLIPKIESQTMKWKIFGQHVASLNHNNSKRGAK